MWTFKIFKMATSRHPAVRSTNPEYLPRTKQGGSEDPQGRSQNFFFFWGGGINFQNSLLNFLGRYNNVHNKVNNH